MEGGTATPLPSVARIATPCRYAPSRLAHPPPTRRGRWLLGRAKGRCCRRVATRRPLPADPCSRPNALPPGAPPRRARARSRVRRVAARAKKNNNKTRKKKKTRHKNAPLSREHRRRRGAPPSPLPPRQPPQPDGLGVADRRDRRAIGGKRGADEWGGGVQARERHSRCDRYGRPRRQWRRRRRRRGRQTAIGRLQSHRWGHGQ